jgi:hypothetical protein
VTVFVTVARTRIVPSGHCGYRSRAAVAPPTWLSSCVQDITTCTDQMIDAVEVVGEVPAVTDL